MLHAPLQFWRRKQFVTAQFAITIAIGLGATTALSSLMLAIGYQALPYRDPKQLVVVWERAESGAQVVAVSGPRLTDFAEATRASIFATLGAFAVPQRWLLDRVGATQIRACYIQASALSDLGVRPVLGREARPDDEPLMGGSGTAPVWISSHFWQTRYNSNQSVIGSTIGIASSATGSDQTAARIVGVLPSETAISLPFMDNATDVWYILAPQQLLSLPRQATMFFGIGRLRPGVSAAQAQAALTAIAERLEQRFSTERGRRPVVLSLEEIAQGLLGGRWACCPWLWDRFSC